MNLSIDDICDRIHNLQLDDVDQAQEVDENPQNQMEDNQQLLEVVDEAQEVAENNEINPEAIWRIATWSLFSPWILMRDPNLRLSRFVFYISSCLSGIGVLYSGLHEYYSLGHSDSSFYVLVSHIASILSIVAVFHALRLLPHFQFRYAILSSLFRPIVTVGEVYTCALVLGSIRHHSIWLCWLYVAGSAYSIFTLRILFPTYDFLIPALLAQVGMNESLYAELKHVSVLFRFGIFGGSYASFVLRNLIEQGVRKLLDDRFVHTGVWRLPSRRIFSWCILIRTPTPPTVMGYCFLVVSFLSGLALAYSGWLDYCATGHDDLILYMTIAIPSLFISTLGLYYALLRLPHFQFRRPILSVFIRPFGEIFEVFMVFQILGRIGRHSMALCWLYTTGSAYAMYTMRIIFPTYDFLVPTALAEVSMNESLHNDDIFWIVLASYLIYFAMDAIDREVWTNLNVDRLIALQLDNDDEEVIG